MLNIDKHENSSANEYELFISISKEISLLSWVEHETSSITSGQIYGNVVDHYSETSQYIWYRLIPYLREETKETRYT